MKIAFIPARLQTPILHAGHLTLIGTALQECDNVYILLGCKKNSDNSDDRNPYDFITRSKLLYKVFPQVRCVALYDTDTNEEWNLELDNLIKHFSSHDTTPEILLYHSRDSFKEAYIGEYKLREVPEIEGYSGTKIREQFK